MVALLAEGVDRNTTTTARWDRYGEVMAGILKRRTVSRADLENIGGICEI